MSSDFDALAAEHSRALHLHCYRMLGSYHDAEEATQEALLRALAQDRHFRGTRADTALALPDRHDHLPQHDHQPGTPTGRRVRRGDLATAYPDELLDQLPGDGPDPAAVAENRETVKLAFVAALQALPATQRAMLILRDVLAWPAAEVAELLETSVAAVNSGLQRARSSLPVTAQPGTAEKRLTDRDREVAQRFVAAWNRSDVTALAALLREDAILRMPPERMEIQGAQAVTHFFATVPAGGALDLFRLAVVAANGSPAVAAYLPDHTGWWAPYGLMVLETDGELITAITGFPQPGLFPLFGLPDQLQEVLVK